MPACATSRIRHWRPRRGPRWRDSKKVPGRGAGPSLPRRNRLQPLPAAHLHLGPGGGAPGRPPREPRGPARERPGRPRHPPARTPTWRTASRPWKGEQVLAFLRDALPGRAGVPRLVVLDNAGIHRSRTVRQARRELAEQGIWLWYLPAYSPELNDIERTFRTVKHGAMPQRTFTTTKALTTAVEAAFEQVNTQLQPSE